MHRRHLACRRRSSNTRLRKFYESGSCLRLSLTLAARIRAVVVVVGHAFAAMPGGHTRSETANDQPCTGNANLAPSLTEELPDQVRDFSSHSPNVRESRRVASTAAPEGPGKGAVASPNGADASSSPKDRVVRPAASPPPTGGAVAATAAPAPPPSRRRGSGTGGAGRKRRKRRGGR
eukprot:GHVU01170589.1.p1 GENE.GHVU01170589.1~~GHVU01170589.1.p1  ORF type:complete len:177 (-),score=10.99 GHVU01170589.1:264-794(-)